MPPSTLCHGISPALGEGPSATPQQTLPPGLISTYTESCQTSAETEKPEYVLHWGNKTEWVLLGSEPRPQALYEGINPASLDPPPAKAENCLEVWSPGLRGPNMGFCPGCFAFQTLSEPHENGYCGWETAQQGFKVSVC